MEKESSKITIDELSSFCKRKGFVYPTAEIYGGLAGFWDFGHLGVELKNNIKKEWWNFHVYQREDIVGIDGAIITNPKVWEASGHLANFTDVAIVCKKCKKNGKIDKKDIGKAKCEFCGSEIQVIGDLNLMFATNVGTIQTKENKAYLRPETAQLIFTNFKLVQENARLSLPFGIAQIGKSFRNEIAPRDFLFRCREFEQMEIEYFASPNDKFPYEISKEKIIVYSSEAQEKNKSGELMSFESAFKKRIIKSEWIAYWLGQEFSWFIELGASPKKFRIRQHLKDEKSHYAVDTWDLEYQFPFGWKELQGLADRGNFDLSQHEKFSKENLKLLNEKGEKILPNVVCEPSQGVERAFLVFMFDSYEYDKKRENIVLHLHPKLAPIKAAIFPIVKDDKMKKITEQIYKDLRKEWNVVYDETGSVGRRYSRNDEIGTPMCITIDEQTLKDKTLTIRDRDTTEQIRVSIESLKDIIRKVIEGENLLKLGKIVKTRVK